MRSDNNVSSADSSNNPPEKIKPNPFDPNSLRIAPGFSSNFSVTKITTTIPVRKPTREEFFRTSPVSDHTIDLLLLELKSELGFYVISPELQDDLLGEATVCVRTLIVTKTRQSDIFLWPLRSPNSMGRTDNWSASAWQAAIKAKSKWTRITANMHIGANDVFVAKNDVIPEPTWDSLPSMQEILEIAFRGKFIDSYNHPVLKKLRGEI